MDLDRTDTVYNGTLDPILLHGFIQQLERSGFQRESTSNEWTGPAPACLRPFTNATEMTVIVKDGWPYFPPGVRVNGIDSWHADHDNVCLWQAGDNTRSWVTLDGILARIEEWVEDAVDGFPRHGYALDPHLYFDSPSSTSALIDVVEHIGANPSDGQSGNLKWAELSPQVLEIHAGNFRANDALPSGIHRRTDVAGRWFFRSETISPPRNIDQFREALTTRQADQLQRDLQRMSTRHAIFVLFWNVPGGVAPLILQVLNLDGRIVSQSLAPIPTGSESRLMRAGPDSAALRSKSVLVVGIGAIGSHTTRLLALSGVGRLTLVDYDKLWPANLIRHAAHPLTEPGVLKVEAMSKGLAPHDWTRVETQTEIARDPSKLKELMADIDLALDATGDGALAELMARVAAESCTPFVTVALHRGGSLVRIRRQADGDQPIDTRQGHARYPQITPMPDEVEYLGLESGCLAPINNAPPVAVVRAAGMAAETCIDQLVGRRALPDEIIEVYRPTDPPFDRIGIVRSEELPVVVSIAESAQAMMRSAAAGAHPDETGGVLIGTTLDRGPIITHAIEIPARSPSPTRFVVEAKKTREAVLEAAAADARIGYLGEWHSHPSDQGPSTTDRATMKLLSLDGDTGNPVLVVVRPQEETAPELDVYVVRAGRLAAATMDTAGDLPDLEDR